jgi:hypothetical protein
VLGSCGDPSQSSGHDAPAGTLAQDLGLIVAVFGFKDVEWRDAVCDWHLWNGGVLSQQAGEGIGNSYGARRSAQGMLQAALGRAIKLLAFGSAAGLLLGILASRVLAFIVYQATPRDSFLLSRVVLAMGLLGLLATWIPARRALSIDPAILLREE